ncbi:MAG: WG repeat-containing protein, partial [Lachnospiraceae bacterium]|nr:WG repeat-containing protein [Lachnospiraceae bacterium]
DEKYGLADKEGNVLFEPLYDMISLLPGETLLLIRENGLYGIADLQGEIRIPAVYHDISYDRYERKEDSAEGGMLVLTDANGDIESMDINDLSEKIPCCYDSIDWISHDRAVVGHHGELYGIIDRAGKLIELVEYNKIQVFEDGALWMKKGLQSWFYNSKGEKVEINDYNNISKYGDCYQTEKNGKYGFLNEQGKEVIPPIYSRVEGSTVYGAANTYLLWNNGTCTSIIKTGESKQSYISKILLQNEITPRIGLYQEFTKSGSISIEENEYDSVSAHTVTQEDLRVHKKKYRLYDLNHLGEPLLYFEADPYAPTERESCTYSGLIALQNSQLVEVVTVYEYDGYGQGDSVCIWYDKETAQAFLGIRGFWGDLTEHSGYGVVYDKKNGEIKSIASFEYMVQSSMHYSNEELEELIRAGLIYGADDKPYTKEMFEQAEGGEITIIYFVNDRQTTIEKYQELADRYRVLFYVE